ncbi:Orf y [Tanacetum coccineum]|uniref:RNA-directed DNA polymerase n=1 Tax=Tanacetum coccineum TaxID=301880 RepID=A0ABQ4XWG1_9ASTR
MNFLTHHQNKVNLSQFSWEGENRQHFVYNLQKHEDSVRNITNPNSIYIQGNLKFKGFKEYRLHCYIDTGASLCLASKYVFPHNLWENSPREIIATIANGDTIKINQVCRNISLKLSGYEFNIPTIYQQDSGIDLILGNNFCQLFGPFVQWIDRIAFHLNDELIIIKKVTKAFSQGQSNFLESMKKDSKIKQIPRTNISQENIKGCNIFLQINKYKIIEEILDKVCSENPIDPQKTKGWMKASIKLIDPNTVIRVKPMCYSPQDRIEFTKQINELLDMKLIIQSKSPHMSPAFLVENEAEKRRGKKRMVLNYKKINEATIEDSHNLPNMQELLTLLRGKSIFSSLDCKSGFWQVLLDEQSQLLTAFTCPNGHFQWKVVPFGLKQALSIFQRHMQNALRGLENFCTVYLDDIIVFSDNEEKHYIHVLEVLKTISKHGIILSKKKANLFKTKINFLGLEIDQGTHSHQKHILEHLHNFPDALIDKKQLQRFLGVLAYAETYIEKLAKMRKPLQGKLKKDVIWNWTQSDTDYIKKIKKNLTVFPKLYLPSNEDSLIIETDASDDIWGGILKAKTPNNTKKICRYTSGSFKAAEKNYHNNEKELLAVKNVISKFSAYLTPVTFLVRTDNKIFTYFLRTNIAGDSKQGRLVRWQAWFSHYSFSTEHLPGNKNMLADCLTRDFRND